MERNDFGSVHLRASRWRKRGGSQRNERNYILCFVQPKGIINILNNSTHARTYKEMHIMRNLITVKVATKLFPCISFMERSAGWSAPRAWRPSSYHFQLVILLTKRVRSKCGELPMGTPYLSSSLLFIIPARFSIFNIRAKHLAGRSGVSKIGGACYVLATILTTITLLYPQLFFQRDPGLQWYSPDIHPHILYPVLSELRHVILVPLWTEPIEVFYLLTGISALWGFGQGILNGPLYVSPFSIIYYRSVTYIIGICLLFWLWVEELLYTAIHQALFADSVRESERSKCYTYLFISYVMPVCGNFSITRP